LLSGFPYTFNLIVMHRGFRLPWPILCGLVLTFLPSRATVEQQYLVIYMKMNDAERLNKSDNFQASLADFRTCYQMLEKLEDDNPGWEPVLVRSRLEDLRAKVYAEQMKANVPADQITYPNPPHLNEPAMTYPWRTNITTTMFWIGEKSAAKGWDSNWIHDNNGVDDPDEMSAQSGYSSLTHASTLNPFYVALPFNDLAYPELAKRWVPTNWLRASPNGKPMSACKDRWVEIKNRWGRICYAQWEAIGPPPADDASYVFGSENARPKAECGLEISPAVFKYLGAENSTVISWRFVDDFNVQPGMWLRYDEQAVLFRAMRQSAKDAKGTPSVH
jgi:hypothetical protein